ncbi:hypothetical protein D187_005828 [Cystobacter fuscus DSM 2262]|uniref:Big-1 domain-containing protein n=1 Tax=Cystobacter fuscus (strain ATCC 25194 / DSM 2262 / NBRC 100088 / M29) TaxID=1242864 RepID=S9PLS6_CYSF2|nr:hypothetical protein [Cystobacter fuscus]EPX63422.1 hypothetical protein D187_005828 [Cystobacter fuscus DSM 2262]
MRLGLATFVVLTTGLLAACSPPQPATLEFVDQSPAQPRLGEITTLRFRAIDSRGLPQAGVQISFEIQPPVPGVELNPAVASTDESNGIASTQVVAKGGRVSSVVVTARVGDKSAVSPAVTFAGSNSTSRQFTFQCGTLSGEGSGGVHAINAYDDTRHLIAGVKLDCIAHVADRNGDGIVGAQVSFLTEAGTIGPSSVSVTDVVGNAKVLYKTSLPLPDDVAPGTFSWTPVNDLTHTGEYLAPLWMHPFQWVEDPVKNFGAEGTLAEPRRPDPIRKDAKGVVLTNNPRDNLVSMIAVTSGEEAFDDRNNNGAWDTGEPFVDLTEPFVDNNDNGTWDAGERYVDANGNGQWDGKNGTFDPVTLIWVQERILWTGVPHADDRPTSTNATRNPRPVVNPITPATGNRLDKFGQLAAEFIVADPWFNSIARNGDDDGCEAGAVGPVNVSKLTSGRALTYPPYTALRYVIKDQRDPTNTNAPDYPAAPNSIKWSVTARCVFTASPVDGYGVPVEAPPVAGDFIK